MVTISLRKGAWIKFLNLQSHEQIIHLLLELSLSMQGIVLTPLFLFIQSMSVYPWIYFLPSLSCHFLCRQFHMRVPGGIQAVGGGAGLSRYGRVRGGAQHVRRRRVCQPRRLPHLRVPQWVQALQRQYHLLRWDYIHGSEFYMIHITSWETA